MKANPPRLYECEVMHQRLKPRRNGFLYRVFMIDVDVDGIAEAARSMRWLGHNRFNLFSIDDRDHVDIGLPGGIRPNLLRWLRDHGTTVADDVRIRLVTFPRVLGYGFNPVSFYYIHRGDGAPLLAVAEVTNTFREMKLFVVDGRGGDGWQRTVAKNFYVSPFSDPEDSFDFRLGMPAEEWKVGIDDLKDGETVLLSTIRGEARPMASRRLLFYALKYPLLSVKIIAGIHWHALLLWLRGFPYVGKAERSAGQTDVLRPHHSLTGSKS